MILGVLSDTHDIDENTIRYIIAEFKKRDVQAVVHCGDIEPQHLNPELFGNFSVVCALIENQVEKEEFKTPPEGWIFTKPGKRIIDFLGSFIYVDHKLSFEFLTGSEQELEKTLVQISRDYDGVRWLFSGHTHRQAEVRGEQLITYVNPGAIADSFDKNYEFAIVDTKTKQVVFSRITRISDQRKPISIGIISDSFDISKRDPSFWEKLAEEFRQRDVSHIIHCGNIFPEDIGRNELTEFQIYYNLRPDQKNPEAPANWHLISLASPIIDIEDYRFYVELQLGTALRGESEFSMRGFCLELRRKFPGIGFVLCGSTCNALYEEGPEMRIINPGDIVHDRNFTVVCLPRAEITLGHVPLDSLPTFSEN